MSQHTMRLFKASNGYHVDVDGRLAAVRDSQDLTALVEAYETLPGLQKRVRKAIATRVKALAPHVNLREPSDSAPSAAEVEAELCPPTEPRNTCPEVPPLWRDAAAFVRRTKERGEAFIEAFLETAKALDTIREELSNQGHRSDLYVDPATCWQQGCKAYLGISYKTAARWIRAGWAMQWLVGIRDGTITEIPLSLLDSDSPPLDYEPDQGKIRVDQDIRAQAVTRLQSVIDGDCTPYRLWPAFCGGLIGGGAGRPPEKHPPTPDTDTDPLPNPTGRTVAPAIRQLELAIDAIDQLAKRAPKLASAWEALDPPRRLAARQTVCDFLDGLPADLRSYAAKHLTQTPKS